MIKSVSVSGNNVDCVHRFTYLGSDISDSARCGPEVNRRIGRACGVMDSLDKGVWRCRYLCRGTKIRVFRSLVLPVLLYGCETWTLNNGLKNRLNVFGTKSLRRILGYRWSDFVSNDRVYKEARMRCITCIIAKRQLQLHGHVARFPGNDPAAQILSFRKPDGWTGRRGGQRPTWLSEVDHKFRELGMGQAAVWGMASRRPKEYRKKVDAATRYCSACSPT